MASHRRVPCKECGEPYYPGPGMVSHMRTHKRAEEKQVVSETTHEDLEMLVGRTNGRLKAFIRMPDGSYREVVVRACEFIQEVGR